MSGIEEVEVDEAIESEVNEALESEESELNVKQLSEEEVVKVLEAALLTSGKPMSAKQLWRLFPRGERMTIKQVKKALEVLALVYENRGVRLAEVASGYRFEVQQDVFPWLEKLYEEKPAKYSRALMETLSLVAYRQPITRGEIEEVRGVSVSTNIIHTLLEHEWIKAVGHREVPGRPALYATTSHFLDHFGLKSISQLPELPEIDLEEAAKSLEGMQVSKEGEANEVSDNESDEKRQLEFAANDPTQAEKRTLKREQLDQIIITAPSEKPEPKKEKKALKENDAKESGK